MTLSNLSQLVRSPTLFPSSSSHLFVFQYEIPRVIASYKNLELVFNRNFFTSFKRRASFSAKYALCTSPRVECLNFDILYLRVPPLTLLSKMKLVGYQFIEHRLRWNYSEPLNKIIVEYTIHMNDVINHIITMNAWGPNKRHNHLLLFLILDLRCSRRHKRWWIRCHQQWYDHDSRACDY